MRILHASHQQYKYLGARNYLFPVRINNGFVRNQHEVYWYSDRDVARASSWFHTRSTGVGAANKKFIQACLNFQPDLIALSNADILTPDTLRTIRQRLPNVAIFQYFIDTLAIERNLKNVQTKKDVVDKTFVTTAGTTLARLAGRHSRVAFVPNPVDPSIDVYRCHERDDLPTDIFFAGHIGSDWQHRDDLRGKAHDLITRHFPDTTCAFHSQNAQGYLYGADFMRAVGNAKIGLNFSQRHRDTTPGPGGDLYLYSSDRIGIYQGNGLLLFCTREFNLSELYGNDTLVEIDGEADFIDKLRHYLDHDDDRKRVARSGYELGHAEFNERLVSQYMVESTLGLPFSHPYVWPTTSY